MSSNKLHIADGIRGFLDRLPDQGILLFTTFGLDEIAVERLLKDAKVPQDYRIVVFHDIIRHSNPGFLHTSFPSSKTIAIRLPPRKQFRCPVFHSKVWMVLSPKRRILRLAVHSINLTRYHIASPEQTFESFWCRRDLDLPLPPSRIFRAIRQETDPSRIPTAAETWIVSESRDGVVSFKRSPRSAGDEIQKYLSREDHGLWLIAAAPFVNYRALADLGMDHARVSIRSGPLQREKRSMFLHAKALVRAGAVIGGSANLTQQAMMVAGKPVNHETVLFLSRPGKAIARILNKFPAVDAEQQSEDVPGDDPQFCGRKAWEEARRTADCGPQLTRLELDSRKMLARIRLKGTLGEARVLSLQSEPRDAKGQTVPLFLPARQGLVRIPERKQSSLAGIILRSPPVFVEGRKSRKTKALWRRELDLGDLWKELPTWSKSSAGLSNASPLPEEDGIASSYSQSARYVDIREIRDRILLQKTVNIGWLRWILRYQERDPGLRNIPDWIHELKKKVGKHA